jgi:UDP-N-acetylmuramoyl-L-alanyl-D-glutamate--2,6-diaminopimelate ligase
VDPDKARELLAAVSVTGRFETIVSPALPRVVFVIDYAHNGVSLPSILDTLKSYEPKRLICLFGSVGGRTRERRRDLAEAAAYRADLCVLTADNPADEPVDDIIREIDSHFPPDGCPRIHEPDRETAIRMLVEQAEAGDIILLAGKGHETYQLIGTRRVPFSEREILEEAMRERALAGIV